MLTVRDTQTLPDNPKVRRIVFILLCQEEFECPPLNEKPLTDNSEEFIGFSLRGQY